MKDTLILAIETSCDETSVALVRNGVEVVSDVTYSQIETHRLTGGVIPEIASREHIIKIIPCLSQLLKNAHITPKDIDVIAVTCRPGLIGSLLVGVETAKALAYAWRKPFIPVYHIHGHIYSVWLGRKESDISFPAAILTVSGGHNDLYLMKDHYQLEKLGSTLDDAAGEVFDKVAKLLFLPYPGGPEISRIALHGDVEAYNFPRPLLPGTENFSFSGLKTAVKYALEKETLTEQIKADIAASFQQAICETLTKKLMKTAKKYMVGAVFLVGGVSANDLLREMIQKETKKEKIHFFTPLSKKYCTDNAAMIGAAAYFQMKYGKKEDTDLFDVAATAN